MNVPLGFVILLGVMALSTAGMIQIKVQSVDAYQTLEAPDDHFRLYLITLSLILFEKTLQPYKDRNLREKMFPYEVGEPEVA